MEPKEIFAFPDVLSPGGPDAENRHASRLQTKGRILMEREGRGPETGVDSARGANERVQDYIRGRYRWWRPREGKTHTNGVGGSRDLPE